MSSETGYTDIEVTRNDHVATIEIQRPPHNFFDQSLIEQIADTDVTVLIQGESGVGKEIVSRHIHELSTRSSEARLRVAGSDPGAH